MSLHKFFPNIAESIEYLSPGHTSAIQQAIQVSTKIAQVELPFTSMNAKYEQRNQCSSFKKSGIESHCNAVLF